MKTLIPRLASCAHGALCTGTLLMAQAAFGAPPPQVSEGVLRLPRHGFSASVATLTLRSATPLDLVAVRLPAAQRVELHQMRREGSTVRMVTVDRIPLPPGEALPLAMGVGQFHLMAFQVRTTLAAGQAVPVTLSFRDPASGRVSRVASRLRVVAPVAAGSHHEEDEH